MIPFNKPPMVGSEEEYVRAAIHSDKLSGDGQFTRKCQEWLETHTGCHKALLTPSCTQALEMAAILLDIQPGDEVIMPSYTFVSTANAFVLRGATVVFVDVRPDTMNIDESKIEAAVTRRTKAIVPVHYAGVACEMGRIMDIADRHGIAVVEDAAQGMCSTYQGKSLGSIGHMGAFSFHETKNFTAGGEGGALLIRDEKFVHRAEIIREKGTNRSQFFRGMVDKYTWVDIGSSYLPSELQAAYLFAQLNAAERIIDARLATWNTYLREFTEREWELGLPEVPSNCKHNGHMFYVKLKDVHARTRFIDLLRDDGVNAVFHYVPLHSSPFGAAHSRFSGFDEYTTKESERLVRLPLWYGMTDRERGTVVSAVGRALAEL